MSEATEMHPNSYFDARVARGAARGDLGVALGLGEGRKALIFGGYGTSNVGDDAILAGLLSSLPEGTIPTVVSMRPQETQRLHGVRAVPPAKALFELFGTNAVIIGGGGMFSGHMGQMSKLLPAMSLFAGLLRKRVAYYGVGIYASTPGWVQKLLRPALRRAALVTVRDVPSVATLESWGIDTRLVPDMALLLEPQQDQTEYEPVQSLGLRPGHAVVGLALTATEAGLGERVMEVIPEVMQRMQDVDFVFIPMSQHPVSHSHNDLVLAKSLQAEAPALKVLYGYHHPARVLGYFGELDAAVCMRFHSMVFAERAGTPMVPVSYAEKTASWLEERGLRSVDLNADAMTAAIRQAIAQRHDTMRKTG